MPTRAVPARCRFRDFDGVICSRKSAGRSKTAAAAALQDALQDRTDQGCRVGQLVMERLGQRLGRR